MLGEGRGVKTPRLVCDVWAVFPGNQMPLQPGPSGDEEDGVGVFFILHQLTFTGLLSVPVVTHWLCLSSMLCVSSAAPDHTRSQKKGQRGSLSAFRRVVLNKRRGTLWLAVKMVLHKSRKCGPTRLC